MEHADKSGPSEKRPHGDQEHSPSRTEMTENTRVEDADFYKEINERPMSKMNAIFENPLANVSREKLMEDVENFCRLYGLEDHLEAFKKGALVSQNPAAAQNLNELSDEDKAVLMREHTHKWSQPWQLYWLVSEFAPAVERF
jgi:hypothetical protein